MHLVDRAPVGEPFLVGAQHRDREVGQRGPRPFHRVAEDVAALHPALEDAVADRRPRELHDHVRAAGQKGGADDGIGKGGPLSRDDHPRTSSP